jgi:hypothetical protein
MKVKTSELQGAALDWAVASCEGRGIEFEDPKDPWLTLDGLAHQPLHSYTPSTDWTQGGPIIEREKIALSYDTGRFGWVASFYDGDDVFGGTPLIAAMRCYVASQMGGEIELPEELK